MIVSNMYITSFSLLFLCSFFSVNCMEKEKPFFEKTEKKLEDIKIETTKKLPSEIVFLAFYKTKEKTISEDGLINLANRMNNYSIKRMNEEEETIQYPRLETGKKIKKKAKVVSIRSSIVFMKYEEIISNLWIDDYKTPALELTKALEELSAKNTDKKFIMFTVGGSIKPILHTITNNSKMMNLITSIIAIDSTYDTPAFSLSLKKDLKVSYVSEGGPLLYNIYSEGFSTPKKRFFDENGNLFSKFSPINIHCRMIIGTSRTNLNREEMLQKETLEQIFEIIKIANKKYAINNDMEAILFKSLARGKTKDNSILFAVEKSNDYPFIFLRSYWTVDEKTNDLKNSLEKDWTLKKYDQNAMKDEKILNWYKEKTADDQKASLQEFVRFRNLTFPKETTGIEKKTEQPIETQKKQGFVKKKKYF